MAGCRNPGCQFKSADKNELIDHYKSCDHRPIINFLCKICSFGCELEDEMRTHVSSNHMEESTNIKSDEEEVFSESEEESEESEDMELDEEDRGDFDCDSKEGKSKKSKKEPTETSTSIEKPPKSIKYSKNVHFLAKQGLGRIFGLHAYITALQWTLDFQLTHHSYAPLYTDWRTRAMDWEFLEGKEADAYLPKARVSPQFARVEVGPEMYQPPSGGTKARNALPWRHLSLFESTIDPGRKYYGKNYEPGFITLFAGGPVWAQAWCPTSLFVNCCGGERAGGKKGCIPVSQFLAVSCNQDFDSYHPIGDNSNKEKSLIQIWDFGPLTNIEDAVNKLPHMVLGIAHEYGAVWALEWCPSGCYDEELECGSLQGKGKDKGVSKSMDSTPKEKDKILRRLGILAAACSDGTIRIFSVPFPSQLIKEDPVKDVLSDSSVKNDSVGEGNANCTVHIDSDVCKRTDTDDKSGTNKLKSDLNGDKNVRMNEKNDLELKIEEEILDVTSPISSKRRGKGDSLNLSALETPTSSRCKSYLTPKIQKCSNNSRKEGPDIHVKKRPWPIYKPSFVVTLVLDSCSDSTVAGDQWQCLRLSWSLLGKSHRVLAASFSNGLVALWDINTTSPLLRVHKKMGNGNMGQFLRPFHVFLAHTNAVTALALVTCGAEERDQTGDKFPRYIVTGARDRMLKIWDLQDTTAPITTFPRGLISNVVWLTNWLSCVVSNDDGFTHGRSNSKIQAIRQYGYKPCPLLSQNSAVMSVAQSDWLNTVAHGTYAGEACILVAQQLLLTIESLKTLKTRRTMVFYTELIDFMEESKKVRSEPKPSGGKRKIIPDSDDEVLDCDDPILSGGGAKQSRKKSETKGKVESKEKSLESEDAIESFPRTYAEATKRFAILFCDLAVDRESGRLPKEAALKLQQSERMKDVPMDLYPLAAINRMCWNPNLQSFIWLATGHQCGLVRVCRMQKTRNRLVENFEEHSADKVAHVFQNRTKHDSSTGKPSEAFQEDSNKNS